MALSARYAKASDTFDSSISADWENGGGDWASMSWASGGYVQPTNDQTDSAIRRLSETFGDNQYSKVVVQTCTSSGASAYTYVSAAVRMKEGTDESAYIGGVGVQSDGDKIWSIFETNSTFGWSELTSQTTTGSFGAGDYVVMEASGSSLELYTKEGAGSETSRRTWTDSTISSGSPGIQLFSYGGAANSQVTSWEGGDDQAAGASFSPSAGSLTLTGVAPVITEQLKVSPSAGALTLAGVAPTVSVSSAGVSVTVDGATLTLAGSAPTIAVNQSISPAAGALSLTGVAPTLATDNRVSVTAGTLTITGYAPTVKQGVSVSPAAGALAITGVAPSVTEQIKVTPSAGALTITGVAPSVFVAAPGTFAPGYATLTLTGVAPTVTQQEKLSVPAGSLTIAGAAPSVSVGTSISVGAGALAITGVAPTVTTNHNIVVGAAELTLAGYAPVVASPLNFLIEPAQIVLTGVAPSVSGGEASERTSHAGRKRRRRYLVEIDGQDFEVSSVEEAQELLSKAEEVAEEQAKAAVERASNASRRQRRKVVSDARKSLSIPQVRVVGSDVDPMAAQIEQQARQFVDRVSEMYREALQAVETGALLRRAALDEEEEDSIVLMLMNL